MTDFWPFVETKLRADKAVDEALEGYETTMAKAWTGERLARLGYMLGKGCNGADVAADPMFRGFTENEIHRRANMLHKVFTACKKGDERKA